jgi:MFS family permease
MPIFAAPAAGIISTRTGTRPLIVTGMVFQSVALFWLSAIVTPTVDYALIVPAFILAGIGMGFYFGPMANVVLSAVRAEEEGKASGANNAIREIGGVFGIAVLAAIFAANGSYLTGQAYVDGMLPALRIGAIVVAVGAVVALAIGSRARSTAEVTSPAVPELDAAAA